MEPEFDGTNEQLKRRRCEEACFQVGKKQSNSVKSNAVKNFAFHSI